MCKKKTHTKGIEILILLLNKNALIDINEDKRRHILSFSMKSTRLLVQCGNPPLSNATGWKVTIIYKREAGEVMGWI